MNKFVLPLLVAALALALGTSAAVAAKVYKWVDAEGNVHYSDRPAGAKAQAMDLPLAPSPRSTPAKPATSTQKLLESFAKAREAKAEAAAKAEKEQQRREQNCSRARKRLAGLKMGRVFEIDEQGQRHFLSDSELQKRQQEAQQAVEKWCP